VPVEERHAQQHDPDADQDRRDDMQPWIANPGAERDARDGSRGDRADVAERDPSSASGA
jgi:hypothetical protein